MKEHTFGNTPAAIDLYSMVKDIPHLRKRFSNWLSEMAVSMKQVALMSDKRTKVISALLLRNWYLNCAYDYQSTLDEQVAKEYRTIFDHFDNVVCTKYKEACRDMGLIKRTEKHLKKEMEKVFGPISDESWAATGLAAAQIADAVDKEIVESLSPNKDRCPKCGYDWEAHEFAVPAPYCPGNDEDAATNREHHAAFVSRLKSKGVNIGHNS